MICDIFVAHSNIEELLSRICLKFMDVPTLCGFELLQHIIEQTKELGFSQLSIQDFTLFLKDDSLDGVN